MYLRRSSVVKYLIAICLGAPLYCEWLVYVIQPLFWPRLQCEADSSCVKVLFVADPQLQGELLGKPRLLNPLFIWDADRFLKNTFSVVYSYFKPDVMVYLGDLTDEGSIASIPQFHRYVKRFNNIFDVHSNVVQVWLPGDNDIGGESEPIQRDKVVEFEKIFNQPSVITYNNVTFYKVNGITHTYPKDEGNQGSQYRIVVSHYPLTLRQVYEHKIHEEIHPNIIFCAHDHVSQYVKHDRDLPHRETHPLDKYRTVLRVPVDGDMHEVYVPTCSYRMGTYTIGYGAAIIDKTTLELNYAVYWSPRRFLSLFFYLALLCTGITYCLVYCIAKLFYRNVTTTVWSMDKVPLLDRI